MKYSTDIDISVPRDRVVALFSDPDTVSEWQESFIRMDYVSGELGQAGNVHNLVHKMGRREMVMKETILKNDLPDFFSATYEAGSVWNIVENTFTDTADGGTHWHIDTEFRCKGFMKIMTMVMPGMFKKQTTKMMVDFKSWAESL